MHRRDFARTVDTSTPTRYNNSMEASSQRNKRIALTSGVGIGCNVLLVVGKAIVGILTKSVSVISDAINNLTDSLSSLVTMIGTRISAMRPSKKHPFGLGRVEFVTSAIIGMLIFVAGASAVYNSILALVEGSSPTYDVNAFIIIGVAVAVKIVLSIIFLRAAKTTQSDALKASGIDAMWDSVLTAGTLVGAGISYGTGVHLEGYIGIIIGLFILRAAANVFREAASKIIGERTDPELVKSMMADIAAHPQVMGAYDLIINSYRIDRNVASVHVEVADSMTAREIQQLEREIAFVCYQKYHTIMTVGIYAENSESPSAREIRDRVMAITSQYPSIVQTHGFFLDEVNHTMSVDIVIDFDETERSDVYDRVKAELERLLPDYQVIVVLDQDFSVS